MAQADFNAFVLALTCGTGFELFRQAADQLALGYARVALVVNTDLMTRNPKAAYMPASGRDSPNPWRRMT